MFLMMTHSVILMMINRLCLIMNYTNLKRMDDNHYQQHQRTKSDSNNLNYTTTIVKTQSFNNLPEIFDLPNTDNVYDSPVIH